MGGCLLIIVFLFHWLLVNANNNGTIIEDSSNQDNPYMTKSAAYKKERQKILDDEERMRTGKGFQFSAKETDVNKIFMDFKEKELTRGYRHEDQNTAALHFFKAKSMIEKGDVFPFLKLMPKGALLHMHDVASVSSKWIINNLTYMPGMLRCRTPAKLNILTFRKMKEKHDCKFYYKVSDEREDDWFYSTYDDDLEKSINLRTAYPEMVYPTIGDVWNRFQGIFSTMDDVFAYLPAFRRYIWQMLTELYLDNVMYAEIRSSLKQLYDEKGKTYPKEFTAREYIDINKKFVKKYPDFLGVKIIFCGHRRSFEKIRKSIQEFKQLHKDFPDFIIGFDIVGQEDPGKTLYSVLDYLEDLPKTAKLFFHGGETNWSGGTRETNLLDAILLKTTRIGHGYALAKHPILLEKVINNTIALEVSPISNQVLNLVWDLRNHPAAIYLSQNIPMSITSDDPGFWGAKGLSYDFYYAIMSLAPNNAGLRLLKALVWHSIDYSILTSGEKQRGLDILDRRWNNFLTEAIKKWGKKKPNKNKQYGED